MMTNLATHYLGMSLRSPIVVGACSLSKRIETIRAIEDSGAGALVVKSLFEEQIQLERNEFDFNATRYDNVFQEAVSLFPRMSHAGAREHIFWLKKAKKEVSIPLIASLNCVSAEMWVEYAVELAEAGVDALELNFYSPVMDSSVSSGDIEKSEIEVVARICDAVRVPVSVKLHSHYTNLAHVVSQMENVGAKGFVLFNRFFQPDINVQKMERQALVHLSHPGDIFQALRWSALLHDKLKANIAASGGVETGQDAVKLLLAGANVVQVVSSLYRNGPQHISKLNDDIVHWMRDHQFQNVDDFRGILGKRRSEDAWSFERGQYIKSVLGFD
jgi:dihydroorotate dehydrogenase (fumarate)